MRRHTSNTSAEGLAISNFTINVARNDEDMYLVHEWESHRAEELQLRLQALNYDVTVMSYTARDAYGNSSNYAILIVPHGAQHTDLFKECEKGRVYVPEENGSSGYFEVERFYGPNVAPRREAGVSQFAPVDFFQPATIQTGTVAALMAPSVRFFPRTSPTVMQSDPIQTCVANPRISQVIRSTVPGVSIRDAPVHCPEADRLQFF